MGEIKPFTQAIILAGGRGERLRPFTDNLPKPMVPVNGKPFLEYVVELLRENGITEIVMLLGYLPEKITEYFGDGKKFGVSIKYSIGSVDDFTGTRVRNAAPLLADEFLLLYSDNYWPLNLEKLTGFYREKNVTGSLVAYSNVNGDAEHGQENNVRVQEDGRVAYYGPFSKDPNLNAVDIGFFLMKKNIIDMMPKDNFSFEHTILPKLIQNNSLAAYVTDHPYYAITTVGQIPVVEDFFKSKKVIFLDRDGIINRQMPPHDYVKKWEEFEFLPGVLDAFTALTKAGYEIYIITNQRGISRGLMTEDDLKDIHIRMTAEIEKHGGQIAGIYHCSHGNDDNCLCRKPKPGMFFQAAREHKLNLTKSVFIGDTESDRLASEAAGCKTIILKTGEILETAVKSLLNS
ncbi:MAG: HAD-IIIA family hydrolase [Patescibacteria group bacterium]